MRRQTFGLSLLCAALFMTAVPMAAQQDSVKIGEDKPLVILGREEERCLTLLEQLKSAAPDNDYRVVPMIQTQPMPFELPVVEEGKQPVFLFTSPRAVEYFVAQDSLPKGAKVMALGTGTQKAIEESGYKCDLVSSVETTKGMAEELLKYFEASEKPIGAYHFIQPTCDIAGDFIQKTLEGAGATYTRLEIYQVVGHPALSEELSQLTQEPKVVLFYSPSGVRSWVGVSDLRPAVVSIGPVTSKELRENGFTTIYESPTPHEEDLLATLLNAFSEADK
ncbi:uroporphyrinogen-III synthase [Porphyromonas levii]|uniref:uroporphyrinogen-III synthase n=1 Tax=Porphyromonas levii TaxID=28114 RepID=UPI001BA55FD4|nr:uroporphyrinogen-III synthase [Porphyromonas levii]MBR8702854.1 hypothetical protein [Porphyromonas levii]